MKFSDLTFTNEVPVVTTPARLLRLPDAVRYVGSEAILRELQALAGLKPFRQQKRLTVFDRIEIDKAIDQVREM